MNKFMKKSAVMLLLIGSFQAFAMNNDDKIIKGIIENNKDCKKVEDYSFEELSDSDLQDLVEISDEEYQNLLKKYENQKEVDVKVNSKLKEILSLDKNKEISTKDILMMKKNKLNDNLKPNDCKNLFGKDAAFGDYIQGQTNFSVALIQNKDQEYIESLTNKLLACGGDINLCLSLDHGSKYPVIYYPITSCMESNQFDSIKKFITLGAFYDVPMQFCMETLCHIKEPLPYFKKRNRYYEMIKLLENLDTYTQMPPITKLEFLKKLDTADQEMYLTIALNDDKTSVGLDYFVDNNITKVDHVLYLMAINKAISLHYLPYLLCKYNIRGADLAKIEKNNFKYNDLKLVAKNYLAWMVRLKNKLKLDFEGDCIRNIFSYLSPDDAKFLLTYPKK